MKRVQQSVPGSLFAAHRKRQMRYACASTSGDPQVTTKSEPGTVQQPAIMIIVGVTGDLARRYVLPALARLAAAGQLPPGLRIVGITRRTGVTADEVLNGVEGVSREACSALTAALSIYQMDLENLAGYQRLASHLVLMERSLDGQAQRLFHLSVPPQFAPTIIGFLGRSGLAAVPDTKLLMEKPFGSDLATAEELMAQMSASFKENQVYRIDHYLAKPAARQIPLFRTATPLIEKTWNKDFIERIEVVALEKIGIEGRAVFYEQTGALRDMVQSHLLELTALTLMELPAEGDLAQSLSLRQTALEELRLAGNDPPYRAWRGQYRGYDRDVNNPGSKTETFASLNLKSTDRRWQGVPITLTTGKALDNRCTEIRLTYRLREGRPGKRLVIRIQPDPAIKLEEREANEIYDVLLEPQDAYEHVLLAAIKSDRDLFVGAGEVLASWRLLQPVLNSWSMRSDDLIIYERGSSADSILNGKR